MLLLCAPPETSATSAVRTDLLKMVDRVSAPHPTLFVTENVVRPSVLFLHIISVPDADIPTGLPFTASEASQNDTQEGCFWFRLSRHNYCSRR